VLNEFEQRKIIDELEATGNFRVLRRLALEEPAHSSGETTVAVVLDTETNGLDSTKHKIIELAVRRIRFDVEGQITKIDKGYSWLEDPGEPLSPEIMKLTGLTDADLAGRSIDADAATKLLLSASFIIAHNAGFDRRFVEERLPVIKNAPWACSRRDVDWLARGFDGESLGFLLMQSGWYHAAHRASGDVDAIIAILQHRSGRGPPMKELFERASAPSLLVNATGAHFDCKDLLRARGYRWNNTLRVWQREIQTAERETEQSWLDATIYAPECRPRAPAADIRQITWRERHL
jgi:DNA polymerase III subunit epsilon